MSKKKINPVTITPGQVWRIAKSDDRFFRVVSVDLERERADVVTASSSGNPVDGRTPYSVTTRSFGRGRYVLEKEPRSGR